MTESITVSFVIVFVAIAIISLLSKHIKLPVIVIEILVGILLGKSFLDIVPDNGIVTFFSSFGLVYLMFLAGLDVNIGTVRRYFSKTVWIILLSIAVPFSSGVLIASFVGVHPLLLGTILSTTSLGLILPLKKEMQYDKRFLHILLASVITIDIISIFLLAFSLAVIQGNLQITFAYSMAALFLLFLLPWLINKYDVKKKIGRFIQKRHFESEVRFSFALIFLLAAISGELGFHSIIGAFIAGLIISEVMPKASLLDKKLESFGYGFFIPLFFIFVGADVNLPALFSNLHTLELLILIVVVGILSKLVGVGIAARAKGFSWRESLSQGFFHAARLSLIIAAVEIGSGLGLIDQNLFSIFVILAVVSSLIGPSLGKYFLRQ